MSDTRRTSNRLAPAMAAAGLLILLGASACGPDAPPVVDSGTPPQSGSAPPREAGGATAAGGIMAEAMVAAHDEARARDGVAGVVWSDELARHAQEWADRLRDNRACGFEHRPTQGAFARKYGENLYRIGALRWSNGSTEPMSVAPAEVVEKWYAEKQYYDYASNRCSGVCGHYTQVVWATSTNIGCARAVCPDDSQIWVCNYDPPGNYVGRRPY